MSDLEYGPLLSAAQRQIQERDLLDRVRSLLARGLELSTVLKIVVEATVQTFGYTHVSIYLLEGDMLVLQHQVGYTQVISRLALGDGVGGRVVRTGRPVLLADVRTDPAFLAAVEGIRSEVCVPIRAHDVVIGFFNLESTDQMVLGEADLRIALALGEDIGIAVERARLYTALRDSEERFASAFEFAPIGVALVSPDGRWIKVNRALCALVGYTAEALLALTFQDITYPDDLQSDLDQMHRLLAGEIQTYQMEKRYIHLSGAIVWVQLSVSLVRDSAGAPLYLVSQIQDINERKRTELAILRHNAELAALNHLGQALSRLVGPADLLKLIYTVAGQVLDARNLYIALYDEARGIISFPLHMVGGQPVARASRPFGNGITEHVIRTRAPLFLPDNVLAMAHALGIEPQGQQPCCYLVVPLMLGDKVTGVIGLRDYEHAHVYDHQHLEILTTIASQASVALENARLFAETQRLARTDVLTGIPNRRYLFELCERELNRARRFGHPLAALMLDVDRFKLVNDTYGHAVGDVALRALADCCTKNIRDIDMVGRYGGEEFVVLLLETDVQGAELSAERLRSQAALIKLPSPRGPVGITISVGVAARAAHDDLPALLARADQALYAAKQAGRNRIAHL